MIKILDVLKLTVSDLEAAEVDCGSCPVSMACAIGAGGNGWKFSCCGSTAVVSDDGTLRIIDCGANHFGADPTVAPSLLKTCPLCSGDIVEWTLRGNGTHYRYVRTVHARVPALTRLKLWEARLEPAGARIRAEHMARRKP